MKKKLQLNKEQIRVLTSSLDKVRGGLPTTTYIPATWGDTDCPSEMGTCGDSCARCSGRWEPGCATVGCISVTCPGICGPA